MTSFKRIKVPDKRHNLSIDSYCCHSFLRTPVRLHFPLFSSIPPTPQTEKSHLSTFCFKSFRTCAIIVSRLLMRTDVRSASVTPYRPATSITNIHHRRYAETCGECPDRRHTSRGVRNRRRDGKTARHSPTVAKRPTQPAPTVSNASKATFGIYQSMWSTKRCEGMR